MSTRKEAERERAATEEKPVSGKKKEGKVESPS